MKHKLGIGARAVERVTGLWAMPQEGRGRVRPHCGAVLVSSERTVRTRTECEITDFDPETCILMYNPHPNQSVKNKLFYGKYD